MPAPCPRCTTPVPDGARFCPSCGAPSGATRTSNTPTIASDAVADSGPRRARFVAGEVLAGRYRVERLLGRGGMGEVYKAEDLKLDQEVALKFLPAALAQSPSMLARFHNEVRLARQVTHANVCRVHDIGEVDGQHYITMEYVDGENLASLLRRIGRLPADKAVEIARQMCAGLSAAHERGVLHRDLKPENVMLDGAGRVRLMDFGLAGIREQLGEADLRSGTPAYMAPEQMEGKEVSVRSDLYALGLVLHEMFTGRQVFDAPTLADLKKQRASFVADRTSVTGADVDPAVERVVQRCLESDPARRPASAIAIAMALPGGDPLHAALAAGEIPSPEMVAAAGGKVALPRRLAWGIAAAAVVVIACVGLVIPRASVLGWVTLDRPPDAMVERARDVLARAGVTDPPADSARGYGEGAAVLDWLQSRPDPARRWDPLRSNRLSAIPFWYRQSPRGMRPVNFFGRVTPDDPHPAQFSGDATVFLDEGGRLTSLHVTPAQELPAEAASPPDWSKLFEAAGLDLASFTEVPPEWAPEVWADDLRAWKGPLPGVDGVEVRVEASSARGRVATFDTVYPWSRAERMAPPPTPMAKRIAKLLNVLLLCAALGGSAFLTWRNLRSGRSDRRGAWRLAGWAFVVTIGQWACFASHALDGAAEWTLIIRGAGFALFIASLVALLYLGIEPFVRKVWPDALISWTRLLAGRWRDPLVGRDVLAGIATSAALTVAVMVAFRAQEALGYPTRPGRPDLDGVLGGLGFVGQLFAMQINSLVSPMVLFLLLVGLRALLKTTARAFTAAVALLGVVFALVAVGQEGGAGWITAVLGFVQISALFWILVRFGLLAGAAATIAGQLGNAFPMAAARPSAWFAPYGWAALAVLALLAGWAAATASRKSSEGLLVDDSLPR